MGQQTIARLINVQKSNRELLRLKSLQQRMSSRAWTPHSSNKDGKRLGHAGHIRTPWHIWVWVNTYRYIFSGMNIHLPAILGFTRYQGFDPSPFARTLSSGLQRCSRCFGPGSHSRTSYLQRASLLNQGLFWFLRVTIYQKWLKLQV